MSSMPKRAMVLAAGLGLRMRPITLDLPKPLVRVGGRTLLDHALDRLEAAGVEEVVVNAHWLADKIASHLESNPRADLKITLSREDTQLETGGGVRHALPLLGDGPFFVVNADIVWLDGPVPALRRLADAWNPDVMDALLLVTPTATSIGYDGRGDYQMDPDGRLTQGGPADVSPFVMAGVSIMTAACYADAPDGAFSNLALWQRAEAAGRLYGVRHEGNWYHVGTPAAVPLVDSHLRDPASREVHP